MPACGDCTPNAPSDDRRFRRVLWVALVVNVVMFGLEILASALSGSMALLADALDFLGDSASYAITLLVLGMSLRARASAALLKGAAMAGFGVFVLASTIHRVFSGTAPDAGIMGAMAIVALLANVGVAALLFRYRDGDSNRRSIWLCTRNDALANVAVLLAAGGVAATASHWPDLLVAGVVATLCLHSALEVLGRARAELREHEASVGEGYAEYAPATKPDASSPG